MSDYWDKYNDFVKMHDLMNSFGEARGFNQRPTLAEIFQTTLMYDSLQTLLRIEDEIRCIAEAQPDQTVAVRLKSSIAASIRAIRLQKGLTGDSVAKSLGIEQPNYFRLEKRGEKLTIEQLRKIADALGVTVYEILFTEEVPNDLT